MNNMKHLVYQTRYCCIIFFIIICFLLNSNIAKAGDSKVVQGKKVLVVASYHSEYKWVQDIIASLKINLTGALSVQPIT